MMLAVIAACGGEKPRSVAPGQAGPVATPTPAAGPPSLVADSELGKTITPQMIALGDSIFHGLVAGGTCHTCHGPDAKGTALAPNLTDSIWLNGDGTYQFIVRTVTTGVPVAKQHPDAMPPMGGARLTSAQVQAVAAYVYSLGHKL
jgi:mono/diheme cytochrome c family protein